MSPLRRRALAIGALAIGLAVVALAVLTAQTGPGVIVATPQPAPPTASAIPAASGSPVASATSPVARVAEYGYVFALEPQQPCTAGCAVIVRREGDGSEAFRLDGVLPAVSPDGTRLAYWRTTRDVGAVDLRVVDVADPKTDHSVLALPGDRIGGTALWSNDGQGLLLVTRGLPRPSPPGGPLNECWVDPTVLMLDLTMTPPGVTTAVDRSDCVFVPVAWDRPGRLAATVTTGPGGFLVDYVTWDGSAATPYRRVRTPRDLLAFGLKASDDAKLVLTVDFGRAPSVRVWPLGDIARSETAPQPSLVGAALWRPGQTSPYEVLWESQGRVEVFRYPARTTERLIQGSAFGGPRAVRPDGSGALLSVSGIAIGAPSGAIPEARLVPLDLTTRLSGRTIAVPALTANHTILPRGVIFPATSPRPP